MQTAHGGDIEQIRKAYGIPGDEIIAFSANINPLGAPQCVKDAVVGGAELLSRYPDVGYARLRECIGAYAGVDSDSVIVGNGATELISLYIRAMLSGKARGKAVIVSPAYSEYEREVNNEGVESVLFRLKEEDGFTLDEQALFNTLDSGVGMLIMCNPNNPTGAAIRSGQMERILARCAELGTGVMVDETYAEFASDDTVMTARFTERYDNLFTVRGTSKFFAAPGLRLGYGLCGGRETLNRMNALKDPWSVNILAAEAGRVMFSDKEYIAATKALISDQRERMYRELASWPCIKAYESQANFILIRLLENCGLTSAEIFEKMLQKRLLIRDCRGFSFLDDSFIRFCVMKPEQNDLLLHNLKKLLMG